MLTFQPKTEEELMSIKAEAEKSRLFEKDNYPFKVIKSDAHTAHSGNKSIKIKMEFYAKDGKTTLVDDFLTPLMMWKLKHFCSSVGIQKRYEEGCVSELDCDQKCGIGTLGIAKYINNQGETRYKNVVLDYVLDGKSVEGMNDDLPW